MSWNAKSDWIERKTLFLLALFFIAGLLLRASYSSFVGFAEPDSFYHYSLVIQTVANHYTIPAISKFDGAAITTEPMLIWMVEDVYRLLGASVSILEVMRWLPLLFWALLYFVFVLFAKEIWDDDRFILISAFILVFSLANIDRSFVSGFRGDVFVSLPVLLGLLFTARAVRIGKYYPYLAVLSFFFAGLVWGGGQFLLGILAASFIFSFVMEVIVKNDAKNMRYTLIAVLLALGLISVVAELTLNVFALSSAYFGAEAIALGIIFLIVHLVGELTKNMSPAFKFSIYAACLFVIAIAVFLSSSYFNVAYSTLLVNFLPNSNLAYALEETTPPTPSFLFSAFSTQLYMIPSLIFVFAGSVFGASGGLIAFLLSLPLLLIYFVFPKKEEFDSIKASFPFLLLLGYYATTVALMSVGIRYVAIASVPIALLSAYTLLLFVEMVQKEENRRAGYLFIGFALLVLMVITLILVSARTQADDINPQFLSALNWIKANTPANSTFLALWSDGSVIEGYAQRFSFSDSVAGLGNRDVQAFDRFLLNSTPINSDSFVSMGKPDYLLIRNFSIYESYGIALQANLSPGRFQQNTTFNLTKLLTALNGTNMMKLIDGCQSCENLTLAYQNNDTKIYAISYK